MKTNLYGLPPHTKEKRHRKIVFYDPFPLFEILKKSKLASTIVCETMGGIPIKRSMHSYSPWAGKAGGAHSRSLSFVTIS